MDYSQFGSVIPGTLIVFWGYSCWSFTFRHIFRRAENSGKDTHSLTHHSSLFWTLGTIGRSGSGSGALLGEMVFGGMYIHNDLQLQTL